MINLKNCTVKEFIRMTEHKQVVCFCAGQKLLEFCERFQLEDKIIYAVDNFKGGQKLHIGNGDIPVISMEQLDCRCKECVCIITSMGFADEIILQLDQLPVCDGMNVYVYELLEEERNEIEWEDDQPQVIPKKIHYFWFGKNNIPKLFRENIDTWKKYCPDYEIIQWNDDNYDVTKNEYMHQAYEKEKWGFVPDYARLDVVNTYGGIYLDTDVRVMKSFDPLLQYDFFCGFENAGNINFGHGFGAKKHHPIIQEMMHEYEKISFTNEDGSMNTTASPFYQTAVLKKYGLEKNGLMQQWQRDLVLPSEYFSPVNEFGYGVPTANTFSVHQYAGTWYDDEQQKRKRRIIDTYEYVLGRIG